VLPGTGKGRAARRDERVERDLQPRAVMTTQPLELKVPFENVNDVTAKILSWKVSSGKVVKAGEVIAELENSKASFEVTAPTAGVVEYSRPVGEEVPVGETLCRIFAEGSAPTPAPTQPKAAVTPSASSSATVFSKKAKELADELGMDAALFAGMTFVKETDVRQKAAELGKVGKTAAAPMKPEAPTREAAAAPDQPGERVPLERAKRYENRELVATDQAALKSTLYYFCPAAGLQQGCANASPPIPRLAIVLFETVKLLKKYPLLNAYFMDDAVFKYRDVNIGFAVDMGHGLKVLVIHGAEKLSFAELTARIDDLLVKYSTSTLAVADVTGSTFTITDLGYEGVFTFDPLINSRQAAILGLGAEGANPAGIGGGLMLSCAFDHRLIGGKQVAEFMRDLSARLVGHAESLGEGAREKALCCSRCMQSAKELRGLKAFLIPSAEPAGYICSICLAGH
jgi:pyruvate/2-oxoglutarate dehydrogenase complex dihydrolipoamide acyltransferase (E2) component